MCRFDWLVVLLLILFGAVFGLILAGNIVIEIKLIESVAAVGAIGSALFTGGLLYVAYMARNQWKEQHNVKVMGSMISAVRETLDEGLKIFIDMTDESNDKSLYVGGTQLDRLKNALAALNGIYSIKRVNARLQLLDDLERLAVALNDPGKSRSILNLHKIAKDAWDYCESVLEGVDDNAVALLEEANKGTLSKTMIERNALKGIIFRAKQLGMVPLIRKVNSALYEVERLH